MKWVSFNLDNPALSVLGENTATGRTLPAGRGIPGRLSDDHIGGSVNERKEIFFGSGRAAGRNRKTSYTSNFEEGSAVHPEQKLLEERLVSLWKIR